MDIGIRIRNLRLQNKLTQKELSIKLNVTSGYISQIENNLVSPSLKFLLQLCDFFQISISLLFQNKPNIELINKKEDFLIISDNQLKNTVYHFFPNINQTRIKAMMIKVEPQGQTQINNQFYQDEFGLVVEGEMTLFIGKLQYLLKTGDVFYLATNKEYYCFNHNLQILRFLKVMISNRPSL
ncbi:MAG: helix-turn-helix domain-containing protein [Vigna little leaf phytoplasma]|nr:helix-turn-helix domain-containing protein [Vigna little leaf phytoplasma]